MRRSVSKRGSIGHHESPAPRSRSAERTMLQPGEVIVLSFDDPSMMVPDLAVDLGAVDDNDRIDGDDSSEMGPYTSPSRSNRAQIKSESSISKIVRSHRRANSDPFDTADAGGVTDKNFQGFDLSSQTMIEEERNALPTMHRFPYAETNNKNCWSEPPASIFRVRGANYLRDHKKVVEKRGYMLTAMGSDFFLSDNPSNVKMSR